MRTAGRIILLVVGALLLYSGITGVISGVTAINAVGWSVAIFTDQSLLSEFIKIIVYGFDALMGLTAVFAGLKGHSSFWLTIFSLLMIAGVIVYFVQGYKANTLGDWKNILNIVAGFALPICYFIGSLLVRAPKKRNG
jgi:hypothetical protein